MKRVLVVDDDPGIRAVITTSLNRDFEIVTATNGREAVDILNRDNHFACVLLDLQMPEMDGGSVFRTMQLNRTLSEIPVIVLTGVEDIKTQSEAMQAGVVTYFRKPFSPSQLRSIVLAVTRNRN
jgi:two-component system, chemotaxis family, chemotaxis protein CheY